MTVSAYNEAKAIERLGGPSARFASLGMTRLPGHSRFCIDLRSGPLDSYERNRRH
jgi:hypothetical protein